MSELNPYRKINPIIFDELIEICKKYTRDFIDENVIEKYEGKNTHKSFCTIFEFFPTETQKKIFADASSQLKLSLKIRANFTM